MPTPKQDCLNQIVESFLLEIKKLDLSDSEVRQRNFDGSFFLKNSDVNKIEARKSVMEYIFKPIEKEIYAKTHAEQGLRKFTPVNYSTVQAIAHLKEHTATLSEEECGEILTTFHGIADSIMNPDPNEEISSQSRAEWMNTQERRNALKTHAFNDKYFFTFLAKLVQAVQEVLGLNTTSEECLEDSIASANSLMMGA